MKKNLRNLIAAAATFILIGSIQPAQATHIQGAEITYVCVSPNVFVATLKIYRDCSGIGVPSATLYIKSQGCNTGRGMAMTKVGGSRIGSDYCPQLGPPTCTATAYPNYEEATYTATVTFSAAETQCPVWTMSWSECCWPNTANLVNPMGANVYTEAVVNLRAPGPAGASLHNSSAQFVGPLVRHVNGGQPVMLSSLAFDLDGDSLVYSLQGLLQDAATPIAFSAYNAPGGVIYKPQDSSQIAFISPANLAYSPTFPLPAYFVDWTLPAPRYAARSFVLDPHNGSLMLMVPAYIPNINFSSATNKYAFALRVDEYRKINGTAHLIGSVRREIMLMVMNCGPNNNPDITAPVANGQPINPGAIIHLRPGTPLTFTIATDDNNPNDILTLESDVAATLPGASFTTTSGNRPTGTLTWTPTAAQVREQPYYFRVTVRDNACPVKGVQDQTYAVRVSNSGGVTGLAQATVAEPAFTAYPNPFGTTVIFKVKQTQPNQHLLIYNVLGQQIDQIVLKGQVFGDQEVTWLNAVKFPAGQYVVRFSDSAGHSLKITKLQ